MEALAIHTIRALNWKWSKTRAEKLVRKYTTLLTKKYPNGLPENSNLEYFVLPNYEHVTRNQPILVFNPIEAYWELTTTTLFIQQKH